MSTPKMQAGTTSAQQKFEVKSGALRVTDPCYSIDTWCSGQLENVMNGTWIAHVGYYMDPMDIDGHKRYIAGLEEEERQVRGVAGATYVSHRVKEAKEQLSAYKGRVAYIRVCHESISNEPYDPAAYLEVAGLDVGVDSGQAGFFDLGEYTMAVHDHADHKFEDGKWQVAKHFDAFYDKVCALSLGPDSFGTVEFGAVSSSGYGDGGYTCYVLKDAEGTPDEKIVAAQIIFIDDEEGGDELP